MTRRVAAAAVATACWLAAGGSAPGAARARGGPVEPRVDLTAPTGDTLATATPAFTIVARDFPGSGVSVRLEISRRADFQSDIVLDTVVPADSATIQLERPLPERTAYYWRARGRDDAGTEVLTVPSGPHVVPDWLVLLRPNSPSGTLLDSRRPSFAWRSIGVAEPPGPWRYDLTITNTATGERITALGLAETTYVPPADLETNTSYRWSVTARLLLGPDTVRVASLASFVITPGQRVLATLLYQNFPNPFPSATSTSTCVWFDLGEVTFVRLEVHDLRGNLVRRIFPDGRAATPLPPGRYGREAPGGCDARFAWDGRSQNGAYVPPGVYLLRLQTARERLVRRVLWRGAR